MNKKDFYFGIYNSWDKYDDELRKEVRKDLADCNNMAEEDVPDNWIDETFDNCWDDETANLDVPLPYNMCIVAFATLGLWNGHPIAYKKVSGNNLNSFLYDYFGGDEIEYYADKYNVRVTAYHHDGRNHVVLRLVDSDKLDQLCEDIYDGKISSEKQLFRRTKSLRPMVADVYGWKQYGWQKKG